jgi:flagellar basal-body rod protein FlgB
MRSALDSYLGIHPQALALEAQRTNVLAANMANADTPHYKARDIDFKAALAAAAGATGAAGAAGAGGAGPGAPAPLPLAGTSPLDLGRTGGSGSPIGTGDASFLKYRVPLAPSLDGNTVDGQLEEAAFAENAVRYQATLTFLNVKLKDLLTAIGS